MPKNSLNVSLKGADDIFSTEESRQEQQREQVQQIPIGELFPSAGAVEQLAVQRAIGVTNFWHTVLILKLCVAFLTGHQIKLLHFCIVLSVFMCQAHNAPILS